MDFLALDQQQLLELSKTVGFVLITLVLGIIILRVLRKGLMTVGAKAKVSPPLINMGNLILRWVIWLIIVLVVLAQIGVEIGSLWAILSAVAAMVAIGFVAVWSLLSNVSCTVLLLIFRPFNIGDEIEVIEATGGDGLKGTVVNLNFMYTTLEETSSESSQINLIQIPNNTFFQKTIRRRASASAVHLDEYLFRKPSGTGVEAGTAVTTSKKTE